MADDAESGREAREYAVLVRVPEAVNSTAARPRWEELGVVQAVNRRGAKDAAVAKWPSEMTPSPSEAGRVRVQFVPARSWQEAVGSKEQEPAPPPKISWEGL